MVGTLSNLSVPGPAAVPPHKGRILIVEDDLELAEEVRTELVKRGYEVCLTATGSSGAASLRAGEFDLLVVDRMLPEVDGLTLLARLREENVSIPVLVISALAEVDERVRGLQAGGDDYLTKPFVLAELGARIEALLRRPLQSKMMTLRSGALTLDLIERLARRDGRIIDLSPREFKLLEYLMRRPGQLVTRTMLLESVWQYRYIPQTNLVDVHIGKLRRKIDGTNHASLIQSIRGQGFVFLGDV